MNASPKRKRRDKRRSTQDAPARQPSLAKEASGSQNSGPGDTESELSNTVPANRVPANSVAATNLPGPIVRRTLVALVVIHLLIIGLSFSAIVQPGATHNQLLQVASPYLRGTHFAADGRPFFLAHGTPDEQPHRLQVADSGDSVGSQFVFDVTTDWKNVQPDFFPGLAASDRYQRWIVTAATLAATDQPSLAAMMLQPLLQKNPSNDAARIIRLPTQLTTAEQDAAPPVYLARVVRDDEQLDLISIESPRLTTQARQNQPQGNAGGAMEGKTK
ncbi:MAG: hypothetical protein AAFV88_00265 [Planctomycetota bacterium]